MPTFDAPKSESEPNRAINSDQTNSADPGLTRLPSRMEVRLRARESTKFLIDPILPSGTLNLLGGPSGIGKSTFLFQMLHQWEKGELVLGQYKPNPCSWVYISNDRSLAETDRTLCRLGYKNWDIPAYAIEDLASEPDLELVMDRFPQADLFVIEGLQAMIPEAKGNQNRAEMQWAIKLRRRLNKGKTIIATTHSPKSSINEAHSRNNFLMSVSLHACCSTMISFDLPASIREAVAAKGKVPRSDEREVVIKGRDFADITMHYTRGENGQYILADGQLDAEIRLDSWWISVPAGKEMATRDIERHAEGSGMSRATLYRWIESAISAGVMQRGARGKYLKPVVQ